MAKVDNHPRNLPPLFIRIYLLGIGYFVFQFISLNHPTAGFAWLPRYGTEFHESKTKEFKKTNHIVTSKYGYDGQFYSQIALSPTLRQDGIEDALDVFNYRARRILFSWTAYAFGLGRPDWALQAYSVQNAIFWLLLAVLLLHWFPPNSWQNTIRYLGTLYAPGMIISATRALLDGPSLFLIALGAYLIEKNKSKTGYTALALSSLGKETNMLSAALIPLPQNADSSSILRYFKRGAFIAIPLGIWVLYVSILTGNGHGTSGANNFDYPLASWFSSLVDNLSTLFQEGFNAWNGVYFLMLVTLMAQALYFLLKPKPKSKWWRMGAVYALLMLILGEAVWQGHIGAAIRVVLPITLAFNILLPKTKRALPLLILVNSLSLAGVTHLATIATPPPITHLQSQNPNVNTDPKTFTTPYLKIDEGWHDSEHIDGDYWRWSSGKSSLSYTIHRSRPVPAFFQFQLRALSSRKITLSLNNDSVETFDYEYPNTTEPIEVSLLLQPGENRIEFTTNTPPTFTPGDSRELAFAMYNFTLRLEEPSGEP